MLATPNQPGYARYKPRLEVFTENPDSLMPVGELPTVPALCWDTVKKNIKAKLQKDHGQGPTPGP